MTKFGGSGKKKQACILRKCNGQQQQETLAEINTEINSNKADGDFSGETKVTT